MPLYEYQCRKCKKRFEKIQSFSDPLLTKCIFCGGKVEKLISPPAIQFKGSGWYVTDYARKGKASEKKEESADKKAESKETSKKETKETASTSK